MREIKFKLYYKSEINRYERCKHEEPIIKWLVTKYDPHGLFQMQWTDKGLDANGFTPVSSIEEVQPDNNKGILVEYTGWKDWRGKEIYGGDILQANKTDPCQWEVIWNCSGCYCGWYLRRWVNGVAEEEVYEYIHGLELIWNIYENNDLIKTAVSP